MHYLLSFLEGIITFISPCILPLFPVYLSYFAGNGNSGDKKKTLLHTFGFTLGFSAVFVSMGAFAGSIGSFLREYDRLVDLISGGIIVLFGLHFIGVLKIPVLDKQKGISLQSKDPGFFSSLLFGVVFSISWTPCVGVFLGSALMLASSAGGSLQGILLLLCYSLGLAVPFLLSAVLIERLKSTFQFIKKNYRIITLISGIILILSGILTMTGMMGYFFALFYTI